MSTLHLKFFIRLHDFNIPQFKRRSGPLFHRWLPDGEKDAIVLDTDDSDATIKIWFNRRGFVRSNLIEFDFIKMQVDPKIMTEQGVLEAGPLSGLLEIRNLTPEEIVVLRDKKSGNEKYIKLGKRVIKKLIYPSIFNFLNILRTNYGQYWIKELKKWDSRFIGLGHYCSMIELNWSLDEGNTWEKFIPEKETSQKVILTIYSASDFLHYITKDDWMGLQKIANEYSPSLAAFLLSRSHQLLDQDEIKYALIESVSALEISLIEYVREKLTNYSDVDKFLNKFKDLSNIDKMRTLATFHEEISVSDLDDCIKSINWRNKVVHEGADPPVDIKSSIKKLQQTIGKLISGPRYKFPIANPGNKKMPIEKWEKEYKKP